MKIGILTQPPKMGQNYGCILQAYALQTMLTKLGCESEIIDIRPEMIKRNYFHKFVSIFVRLFKRSILGNRKTKHPLQQLDFSDVADYIFKNTLDFVNKHIITTEQILPKKELKINTEKYDVFIVGSDQVWRPMYNIFQPHYFLDFVNSIEVKRIAYAASFGVAENEYSVELLKICKPLLKKFDAISVREDSGVKLCKELFDVEAEHVIDTTLFFDAEHYIKLSKERRDYHNDGDCFTYILDKTDEKRKIISKVCDRYNLKPFNVMPKSNFSDVGPKYLEDCIMPSVEQWLDGFNKAKYIITDSFHGCVFSIIFKKPFIAIGNSERGMARFDSLLKMFKLENRLIQSENDLTEEILNSEIDYDVVHGILKKEREKAEKFLKNALGEGR